MTARPSITHDELVARLLKQRPELGPAMVRVALEEATDAEGRLVLLRVLRRVAKAQGMGAVAARAGLKVQSLSRSLSDRGNPTLSTLTAITDSLGVTLTVADRPATKRKKSAARA